MIPKLIAWGAEMFMREAKSLGPWYYNAFQFDKRRECKVIEDNLITSILLENL